VGRFATLTSHEPDDWSWDTIRFTIAYSILIACAYMAVCIVMSVESLAPYIDKDLIQRFEQQLELRPGARGPSARQ